GPRPHGSRSEVALRFQPERYGVPPSHSPSCPLRAEERALRCGGDFVAASDRSRFAAIEALPSSPERGRVSGPVSEASEQPSSHASFRIHAELLRLAKERSGRSDVLSGCSIGAAP